MRHRSNILAGALVLSVVIAALSSGNQQQAPAAHARIALLSSASTIAARTPFTVALAFDVDPGWHLYWKDPGDSGMPPSVTWKLPEGFTAGTLQFPKPGILKTSAGTNYVHEKQFALLVTITPPAVLKPGEKIELSGSVNWLECDADVCLPAKQSVSASVLTGDRAAPANTEQFSKWEAAVKAGEGFDPTKPQ